MESHEMLHNSRRLPNPSLPYQNGTLAFKGPIPENMAPIWPVPYTDHMPAELK
jgi:hypothetical protein